jgi:membrane protein implicated in regulation of membrane protease activity
MAETAQWEYRVETLGSFWSAPKDEDLEAALDEWGQEGWQVISLYKSSSGEKVTVVAMRQLTLATRRRRSWPGD